MMTDLLKEKVSVEEAEILQLFREEQEKRRKALVKKTKAKKLPKLNLVPSVAQRTSIQARLNVQKAKKQLKLLKAKIKAFA